MAKKPGSAAVVASPATPPTRRVTDWQAAETEYLAKMREFAGEPAKAHELAKAIHLIAESNAKVIELDGLRTDRSERLALDRERLEAARRLAWAGFIANVVSRLVSLGLGGLVWQAGYHPAALVLFGMSGWSVSPKGFADAAKALRSGGQKGDE